MCLRRVLGIDVREANVIVRCLLRVELWINENNDNKGQLMNEFS